MSSVMAVAFGSSLFAMLPVHLPDNFYGLALHFIEVFLLQLAVSDDSAQRELCIDTPKSKNRTCINPPISCTYMGYGALGTKVLQLKLLS